MHVRVVVSNAGVGEHLRDCAGTTNQGADSMGQWKADSKPKIIHQIKWIFKSKGRRGRGEEEGQQRGISLSLLMHLDLISIPKDHVTKLGTYVSVTYTS